MTNKPKILLFDLEVSPSLGYAYGKWQTNILKFEQYASIMSISWKWYGESDEEIKHESLASIPHKGNKNRALTKLIYDLFDEADVVMAHNAYRFDIPVATAAFIKHKTGVPSPYKVIDTLRMARRIAKFPGGNGLDELGRYLGVGVKTAMSYKDLWYDCLKGSASAWAAMKIYNNQDIVVMEGIYEALRPFDKTHVNLADIMQVEGKCPKCLGEVRPYGSAPRRGGRVKAYLCNSCGGRSNDNTIIRDKDTGESKRQVSA